MTSPIGQVAHELHAFGAPCNLVGCQHHRLAQAVQVRPGSIENPLRPVNVVGDGSQWLAQLVCQHGNQVAELLTDGIGMDLRYDSVVPFDVTMQIPMADDHDSPAIGMTVNQPATPVALTQECLFDFLQCLWVDGLEQLMCYVPERLLAGEPVPLLHPGWPERDMAVHRPDQQVRRGGRHLLAGARILTAQQ